MPRRVYSNSVSVDFIPQQMGASERDDAALVQNHIVSGSGIAAPPLFLFFDTKLPESADQDIFSFFQGVFHEFQQEF
jgi:hypothetical protein